MKWLALVDTGDIKYVGDCDNWDEADDKALFMGNVVWLLDEADARAWLRQMRDILNEVDTSPHVG
jgi:hypothetical protein